MSESSTYDGASKSDEPLKANGNADVKQLSEEKPPSNFNAKKAREGLFGQLDYVIGLAREKLEKKTTLEENRQRWARIICTAVQTYGSLTKDIEIEQLEERVKFLEEATLGKKN